MLEDDDETEESVAARLALCDQVRPYAEKLRDMATAALKTSGQEWRSVDLQVAFITAMFADAIEEDRAKRQ